MRKLVNPLQYNVPIDELNGVRPLETDDIVKPSISMPVLNSLTDVNAKIVVGKFMRCTPQGHTLKKNSPQETQYELIQYDIFATFQYINTIFSQKVYEVVVDVIDKTWVNLFRWCVPNTSILIQDLDSEGIHQLDFQGTHISFYGSGIPIGNFVMDVYGFYREE